jgi:glycine C-acetyltransferase
MKEFKDIAAWLAQSTPYSVEYVDSLPSPTFRVNGQSQVSFSSNNYLALASSSRLIAAARRGLETYGVGNCESRLLGGNLQLYDALERRLATLKHKESAVLFATGYLANLGVLSTLPRTGKFARIYGYRMRGAHTYAYFSDEFNHLSIREGIRMSETERYMFRHGDMDHLEMLLRKSDASSKIIVTDGVFSQDGDIAPLPDMLALAERYEALVYVDDAHGTGVLGANGEGTSEHFGVDSERLIQMGTLSKAYGAIGGFIATEQYIADILRLSCGAYGFTSTLPPDQALAVIEAIDAAHDEPKRRQRLWDNQRYFVQRMEDLPYKLIATETPIVPIMIGEEALCEKLAGVLRVEGIHIDAVKFPAVPIGKSRLRVQLNAGHTRAQIDHLVDVLEANQDLVGGEKKPAQVHRINAKAWIRNAPRPWANAAFSALTYGKQSMLIAAGLHGKASVALARLSNAINLRRPGPELSLSMVALATAALMTVDLRFDVPHFIFAYLLPILFVAVRFGRLPALVAMAATSLTAAFILYVPNNGLEIADSQDVAELASFFAIALLISQVFGERPIPVGIQKN